MSLKVRTREAVARSLRRLRRAYGMFPLRDERVENDPDFFERGRRKADSGWLGDAGVRVTNQYDAVVGVRHPDAPDRWGIPGGGHEPGETLSETARRELREETGLRCRLTDVVHARRTEIALETDPSERLYVLSVLFSGVCVGGELRVADELLDARWFDSPPESVADFLEPQVERWHG